MSHHLKCLLQWASRLFYTQYNGVHLSEQRGFEDAEQNVWKKNWTFLL